ncbi:hypothetical protein D9613_004419 [Agrocybe pediades]|uniref:Uncharacterized protein n=1 Tax=Agrocybe pediades TaxID=84607 RepID=A0A8H4QKF2_9AGAR|nr:hypothetical protein D9613_004419 [Agrocybe pediades]
MKTKSANAQPVQRKHLLAIALLTAASLYLTWSIVSFAKDVRKLIELKSHPRRRHSYKPIDSYCMYPRIFSTRIPKLTVLQAFIGTDHPNRLPTEQKLVKLLAQESVHYDILSPEAQDEWLWTASAGDGHLRLGKDKRLFAVAMFHELHCLRTIRGVIAHGWNSITKERQNHILHCFNYLRQYVLCAADVTLEPGDFTKRNFTTERVGATHTCVDWQPAYEMMAEKWAEWDEFRVAHNIPWHEDAT